MRQTGRGTRSTMQHQVKYFSAVTQYCNILYRVIDPGWHPATRVPVVNACMEDSPGPAGAMTNPALTEIENWQLFFTDKLFQYIVDQTNLYAKQNVPEGRSFKALDVHEMKQFLGLQMLTGNLQNCIIFLSSTHKQKKSYYICISFLGIIKKPVLSMYWSSHKVLETPFFHKVMSRCHYDEINRCSAFYTINIQYNTHTIQVSPFQ